MSKLFNLNEGVYDRLLRVILGFALLLMVVVGPQTLWGLVGLVPLLTGVLGTCPLYSVFGINTCTKSDGCDCSPTAGAA